MKSTFDLPVENKRMSDKNTPVIPPVVGIGASAGGLAALRIFLSGVPEDSGFAYVIVVHLSPDHDSHLAELLQPDVAIPVQQVTAEVPLRANNVYVIPPGKNLTSIDSHLRLSNLEANRRERAPVDHFFRTLAATHDGHSAAVILTGTGSDGTLGIQEVKANGGLTIVQDPAEAEFDGMPQSALSTGAIDLVLPLKEMMAPISRFLTTKPQFPVTNEDIQNETAQGLLHEILRLIRSQEGSDYTRYKQSTIMRRIKRRMQLANIEELSVYSKLLSETPEEVAALANDFLITVTSFFRDKEVFEELEKRVIPELFKNRGHNEQIRVWSVGCATGEEAYSLAILLLEEAERAQSSVHIQVFASDLHSHSLKKAREGLYPGDIETDVSAHRLERFFQKQNGLYRIKSEVRDLVVFSPHNLLADPPFSKVDLIVCRNVLIYLQRNLQPDIISLFHYALKPKGYLVLGTAETLSQSDLFSTENKSKGIYLKRNVPCPDTRLPVFPFTRSSILSELSHAPSVASTRSFGALHHRMVERFAQPSILVNSENNVVHLSQQVGRYLMHPGGTPTTSVFKLVHENLQTELRSVLHLSAEQKAPCISRAVSVQLDGVERQVVLHASPGSEDDGDAFTLIIFDERVPNTKHSDELGQSETAAKELYVELELSKHRLQKAIDEYETSQEEMRASNEELQSANEELRSTLEELETSKEELQSINEELQTANQENRHKVAELNQLSDDLQHLMSATHIATLFLDRKLRILRFTPQIGELFNLRTVDRGRPLSDLTHRLHYPELISDATQLLEHLAPTEREVRDECDRWYLARMRVYRTADDHINGLVLTFVDITERKKSELALRQSEERYRTLFESIDEGFCVVDIDDTRENPSFYVIDANPAFLKLTELSNVKNKNIRELAPDQEPFWRDIHHRIKTQSNPHRFESGKEIFNRWLEVYAFQLPSAERIRIAVLMKDINSHKVNEEALRDSCKRDAFRVALADTLRTTNCSKTIQQTSCRMLSEYLLAETVVFKEFNSEQQSMGVQPFKKPKIPVADHFHPWRDNPILRQQLLSGKPLTAADISKLATLTVDQKAECHSLGLQSYLVVPLVHDNKLIATLSVFESEPRTWTESEIALTKEVAERTSDELKRTRAEQACREREESLKDMDTRKNEFLAMLSHELRNPLTPILNALYMLEHAEHDPEKLMSAQRIMKRQADLMSRLINDLLDATRIARGKLHLSETLVELSQLTEQTVRDYTSLFHQKNIDLELNIEVKEVWVKGDEQRLSQAIGNILHNCAKFTPNGGKATVSVFKSDEKARIAIKDTGIGMTEELIAQLFQPFFQAEKSLDRSVGGLGLGLALSKRLVELHRGSITATSDGLETGSEFQIIIPIITEPKQPPVIKPEIMHQAPRRVLLIEDNVDSAITLGEILTLNGHTVAIANDGASGLALALDFKPEFVISDLGLPEIDGYEVASTLSKSDSRQSMVLIALSGYAMADDLERTKQAGFDYHLAKPTDINRLLDILAIKR